MMLFVICVAISALLVSNTCAHEAKCDDNWIQFENKCYFVNNTEVKRRVNEENCRQLNASLVSIHSKEENDFVSSILRDGHWYWLGGKRVQIGNHTAKWDDGTKFNYNSRFHYALNIHQKGYDYLQIYPDGDWMYYREDEVYQLCQKVLFTVPEKVNNDSHGMNETMKGYEVDEIIPSNVTNNVTQELNKTFECESGWHRFMNKCYFVNNTKVNREENIQNCAKLNATLVSIHSEAENKFIASFMPFISWYWLGGERIKVGSTSVKWSDGSDYNYASSWFYADEDYEEENEGNNYVQMHKDQDWRFYTRSDKVLQLCQKNVSVTEKVQIVTKPTETKTEAPKVAGNCPQNWYRFQNKCFWKNDTNVRREENEMNCLRMNAQMVSIHSKDENNFISQITSDKFYWLGGRRNRLFSGILKWDDGTAFDFENWRREHFRESENFEFIQFKNGYWIFFRNDRVSQLCQRSLMDAASRSPNSSTISNEMINQLMNAMNDNFASLNTRISDVSQKIITFSSSILTAKQNSELLKSDLSSFKSNVDDRLKVLSNKMSNLATKNEETNEKCKEGWKQWKNKCYHHDGDYTNFNERKHLCKEMNATMITIRTEEENEFIRETFTRLTFWLGAKRVHFTHQWKWNDGSDVIYTNWNVGEPNNLEEEDCIQYYNNGPHSGYWNDYGCDVAESGICEYTLEKKEEATTRNDELAEDYKCDDGWIRFEQKCFLFNRTEVTLKKNEELCKQLNSQLVSIHSRTENDFVLSKQNPKRKYWSGAQRDKSDRSKFFWSDGSVWDYYTWNSGEPSMNPHEDCVVLVSGHFVADVCDSKHSQICQKSVSLITSNNINDKPINEKFVSNQLSEMKHELVDLVQRMRIKEANVDKSESSVAHIYVFSVFFVLIFALFAYFIANVYRKRRYNSTGALLEMRDNESL